MLVFTLIISIIIGIGTGWLPIGRPIHRVGAVAQGLILVFILIALLFKLGVVTYYMNHYPSGYIYTPQRVGCPLG